MDAVRLPMEIEREFEEFLPEIGGDRERLAADEGRDQVFRRVQWTRSGTVTAPARSRRHGSHYLKDDKCRSFVWNV